MITGKDNNTKYVLFIYHLRIQIYLKYFISLQKCVRIISTSINVISCKLTLLIMDTVYTKQQEVFNNIKLSNQNAKVIKKKENK